MSVETSPVLAELKTISADHKKFVDKVDAEIKTMGAAQGETKEALTKILAKMEEHQTQLDAVDKTMNSQKFANFFSDKGGEPEYKSLYEQFLAAEDVKRTEGKGLVDAMSSKNSNIRGAVDVKSARLARKSLITTAAGLTTGTSGIFMPMRLPGMVEIPRIELRIRDLMTSVRMTAGNTFDYMRQLARTNNVSPQVEGAAKAESTYTFDTLAGTVKTIAHWVNVTRQALDDAPWLQTKLNSELGYGLDLKVESEILNGDGSGQHLDGLMHQATAYSSGTYDVAGDQRLDTLRHAKLQARLAGLATFAPDGIVLHPTDMEKIELIKTEEGGTNKGVYILGDPRGGSQIKLVWGLPVVESDSMTAGQFLIGNFGMAATIIDRMAAALAISYENNDNFVKNIATILIEERLGMAVEYPAAFIKGSFV